MTLQERIELLEWKIEELTEALLPGKYASPSAWRLTKREDRLWRCLRAAAPEAASSDRMMAALYAHKYGDPAQEQILRVTIHSMRKKIRAPWKITNVWGRGYMLTVSTADSGSTSQSSQPSGPEGGLVVPFRAVPRTRSK